MQAAAAVGTTALSVGSSIMGGRATARQYGMEALMNERQAKDVDLQALQSSERRREDLRASLAAVAAQRAARGLSLDTPSAIAVERELARQSRRDEAVEKVGFNNQAYALRVGAANNRRAATNANRMGYISAAQTVMSSAGDLKAAFGKGGK